MQNNNRETSTATKAATSKSSTPFTELEHNLDVLDTVREEVMDIKTAMFTTLKVEGGMESRPMQTLDIDDEHCVYFFTSQSSDKVDDILAIQFSLINYVNNDDSTYISMKGKATLDRNQEKIDQYFSTVHKAWFPEGPQSDDLALIRFEIERVEMWRNENSIMNAYRFGKSLIMGNKFNPTEESYEKVELVH